MPAPYWVGDLTVAAASSGNTVTIAKPEGAKVGDVLVFAARGQGAGAGLASLPDGWSSLGPEIPLDRIMVICAKPLTAQEAVDEYTFTFTTAGRWVAVLGILRAVDTQQLLTGVSTYDSPGVNAFTVDAGSPQTAVILWGSEQTSGLPREPAVLPADYTEIANVQNTLDDSTAGSRTALWLGSREFPAGVSTVPAIANSFAGSSPRGISVAFRGTETEDNGHPVTLGDGTTATLTYLDAAGVQRIPASVRSLSPGFATVTDMSDVPGVTWAHRGGSTTFPEMSEWAYDQAALTGYGVLEFSAQRTSDGVWFGLHDNSFTRTSPSADESRVPSAMTWAEVESLQIETGSQGAPRPYYRLADFFTKWGDSHVVVVDPKNELTHSAEFLDLLDAHGGPARIIVKFFGTGAGSVALATAARARGYTTWGYFYQSDYDNGSLARDQHAWTLLGMDITATTGWTAPDGVLSYGKPVVAHIARSQADYDAAIARGAHMVQCANVTGIRPVSAG